MKTLYVIGNGFDIYHGLDTRYQSFANYLEKSNNEVYELLIKYYGLPDIKNPTLTDEEYALWSRFEEALADLDYKGVLDDNTDLIANPGAEEFKDRDWHSFQIEMELIIADLTTTLIKEFNSFILNVNYGAKPEALLIKIDENRKFLNFNYTETLQKFYDIPDEDIFYIHNKSDKNNCTLILGHGTDPVNFVDEEDVSPEGLTEEEEEEWRQQKADEYDFSYESAKQEILTYYTKAFKNTSSIIENNHQFFSGLGEIEKVIVLGHSISLVDIRYFEALKDSLKESVAWYVSYFGDLEKEKHKEALLNLGIDETNFIQINIADLKGA